MNKPSKQILFVIGGIILYVGGQTVRREMLDLKYFKAVEFGVWYPAMSIELLVKLDKFRDLWGDIVTITPVQGGIGREDESGSMHNVLKWGEVRAIDVFPRGMDSLADRKRAFKLAQLAGFNGIGLYTDTKPSNMLHLDTRDEFLFWTRESRVYKYNQIL